MGQVAVTIDGKSYRMACEDGQEDHLSSLAALFDSRVQDMRQSFGEIGDMRLAVMAAITLADEVSDMRRKLAETEAATAEATARMDGANAAQLQRDAEAAAVVAQLAERVERIAKSLAG
jgi:cell division protein ZapA